MNTGKQKRHGISVPLKVPIPRKAPVKAPEPARKEKVPA